jgi:hypothetical protein
MRAHAPLPIPEMTATIVVARPREAFGRFGSLRVRSDGVESARLGIDDHLVVARCESAGIAQTSRDSLLSWRRRGVMRLRRIDT